MAQLTSAQRDTFASSSSCSASSSYAPYDVFINHRGPDVKNTFAGHIYHSLKSRGLQVFLDRPELQTGHNIHGQIKAAIEVASVHIAIFSENYAESKWCLEELVLMLNSRGTILPVFYNVKPFELRWTEKGAYAGALQKHEEQQRYDLPTIGEWKKALSHVADISGFELEACNGDEVELVDKVVQRVLKEVPKPPLHVAKYKIGLQEKLEDFERTVLPQLEEEGRLEAKVLGIHGSGGIGKSTLAKQFFNNKRSNYNVSSFLFDVRENATRKSIEFLQSKLLKDLKGINTQIESWEEGIGILENNLKSCHSLIILDDVDHISQLDALILPIKHVLDPKSLILVTSRDKHVLQSSRMVESSIYRLKGLNRLHSSELFCWHAFFQQHPPPEFEDLVDSFVEACNGLPLSLQVFGALLCQENDRSYWEEQLNGLQTLPLDIRVRLKISYDSLCPEEQQIFLDIACFSIGQDKDKWIRIWGWSGWKGSVGLRNLENKCLIKVSRANNIKMHDHLRDMGRDIAKEEMMPRRLWSAKINDVYDLLEQSTSSVIQVRGIIMDDQESTDTDPWEEGSFSDKEFKISKLQLLEAQGDLVRGILSKVRSPNLNLIWLCWKECPCSSLPSWIPMRDLRLLKVRGPKLERLWQRESQAPVQLRELYIDAPLLEFPDSIGKLQNIEKIELNGSLFSSSGQKFCAQLSALPEEFCDLRFLKYLDLKCCSLQFLPKYFGKLTNLQHIDLSECYKLQTLTDSFGDLTNLLEINLQGCTSLEVLPDSLENLKNLREINLQDCKSLETLPICIENLTNLKKINLVGCESLEEFPNAFGTLKDPQMIHLARCKKLKMLPNSIVNLTELEEINLAGCESLEMLPNALGSLTNLQYICLENCENLEQMPSNSLENLLQLKCLHLTNCHRLTISDQIFGNITSLECLDLSGCIQMEVLPLQVLHQQHLRRLNLLNTRIEELPSGPTVCLSNLEVLILGSPLLKVLPPWLGYLTSLKKLQLHGCKELNYLPDSVGQLAQLKELYITKCGIHYLPAAVMKMKNLKTLGVRDCPLCELPFKKAEDGEPSSAPGGELDFPMETGMKVTFPEGTCPNLYELKITQCHGLLEVGALPTTLLHLDLRGCDALRKIGGLCGLVNLQDLDIRGCCALEVEELLGLETEISLDLLRRKKLRSLKKLKTAFQSYDSDEEKETTVLHGDFCNFFCRDSPIMREMSRMKIIRRQIRASARAVCAVYLFKKGIPNPAQQAKKQTAPIPPSRQADQSW